MSRPKLLDLFCCAGGAAMGYHRAGFEVYGVDLDPRFAKRYPFAFHAGDAHIVLATLLMGGAVPFVHKGGTVEWLRLDDFDAIHASPPCQAHTTLTKGNQARARRVGSEHVDLIAATRDALNATGLPYVIENVTSAPVRPDVRLCGLMFGLRVFRHRLFELGGWLATTPEHPSHRGHRVAGWRHGVKHDGDMVAVYGDGGGKGSTPEWQAALGVDWTDDRQALAEAIPPAYTEHIGRQLIEHLAGVAA